MSLTQRKMILMQLFDLKEPTLVVLFMRRNKSVKWNDIRGKMLGFEVPDFIFSAIQ